MRTTIFVQSLALLLSAIISPALLADEPSRIDSALQKGTLHLMRPNVYWLHGNAKAAFDEASELVLETATPTLKEQQNIIMKVAVDHSGKTLRSKLEPQDREKFENTLEALGMPHNALDALKPWMASMTLSTLPMMEAGYSPEIGVDALLKKIADSEGKTVIGLKDYEEHLGILDSLSAPLQLGMLNDSVEKFHEIKQSIQEIEKLWIAGDIEQVGKLMVESMTGYDESDELYAKLFSNRNKAWADWIAKRMESPGRVFVAVGAAHFAGELNLRELLEARGYTVKRVEARAVLAEQED